MFIDCSVEKSRKVINNSSAAWIFRGKCDHHAFANSFAEYLHGCTPSGTSQARSRYTSTMAASLCNPLPLRSITVNNRRCCQKRFQALACRAHRPHVAASAAQLDLSNTETLGATAILQNLMAAGAAVAVSVALALSCPVEAGAMPQDEMRAPGVQKITYGLDKSG